MALTNIDLNSIPGYAEMSAEDKVKALESFQYENNAETIQKLKESVSQACSDASEWKHKHNALLSEEERLKAEQKEREEQREARIAELEKRETISNLATEFVKLGYSAELARTCAEAKANGDDVTLFAKMSEFNKQRDEVIKADLFKGTPTPPAGNPTPVMTKDTFSKMSYDEQLKYTKDNPDWMSKLK